MTERTFKAVIESIPEVTAFIDTWLESLDCPMKAQMQIDVAVDELFSNIAQYAYAPGTGDVSVQLSFDDKERLASITFIDSGTPYNPLEKKDPDVTLPAEARAIGGLGIFLVKKTMDAMEYLHKSNRNMLTIRKRI